MLVRRSLERPGAREVKTVVGDRNIDSLASGDLLREWGTENAIAPRDASLLWRRLRGSPHCSRGGRRQPTVALGFHVGLPYQNRIKTPSEAVVEDADRAKSRFPKLLKVEETG